MAKISLRQQPGKFEPARVIVFGLTPRERHALAGAPEIPAIPPGDDASFPPDPEIVEAIIGTLGSSAVETDANTARWRIEQACRVETSARLAASSDIDAPPRGWTGALYPYQRVGQEWLRAMRRGILGDDPGLGKTVQALAAVDGKDRVLIATLGGVKQHWADHVARWSKRPVGLCVGSHAERQQAIDAHGWVIVNHEMLRPGAFTGLDRKWDAVIIDEAHRFQGRKSKQSKGAAFLKTDDLYLLTGTPIWNKPDSLWNLLHLLYPARFSSYWRFVGEYCDVEVSPWGMQITGLRYRERERLQRVLVPLMIRRAKRDVLPWLPDKIREDVTYDITPSQRRAYNKLRDKLLLETDDGTSVRYYANAISAMSDMRLLLDAPGLVGLDGLTKDPSPKDEAIDGLLDGLLDDGRKIVIYCWHRAYANYLAARHAARGAVCVTGETKDRTGVIDAFLRGRASVLVATIASVGTGIDMTECTAAIFAEGSYVHVENAQAEDRLHRIGTKTSPLIYRLQARRTVEQAIWEQSDDVGETTSDVLTVERVVRAVRAYGDA